MYKFIVELVDLGNNIKGTVIKGNRTEIKQTLLDAFNKSKLRSNLVDTTTNQTTNDETEYLLATTKNALRLKQSIGRARRGETIKRDLIDPLGDDVFIKIDEEKMQEISKKRMSEKEMHDLADVIAKVAFDVFQQEDGKVNCFASIGKPKTKARLEAELEENVLKITTVEEAEIISDMLTSDKPPNEELKKAFQQYNEMMANPDNLNDLLRIKQEQDIDYNVLEQSIRDMKKVDTLVFENLIIDASVAFDELDHTEHNEYCVSFTDQSGTSCFTSVKDVIQFAKDWSNFKC